MKIALVTDDGETISAHFGRARGYLVLTVVDGVIVARESRPKASPHADGERHADDGGSHDSPAAHARHDAMLAPVADCTYVVARGMGQGAHDRIVASGLRPVLTELVDPDAAALACASGAAESRIDRLH